jgi:hypothetical protein
MIQLGEVGNYALDKTWAFDEAARRQIRARASIAP